MNVDQNEYDFGFGDAKFLALGDAKFLASGEAGFLTLTEPFLLLRVKSTPPPGVVLPGVRPLGQQLDGDGRKQTDHISEHLLFHISRRN